MFIWSRVQQFFKLRSLMQRPNLVVVVGCTGVGKSRLSVELCSHLSPVAEIINADSMQVYKGLPVLTNKIPDSQRNSIPHHLLDFLEPQQTYSVPQFVDDAKLKISEIHQRNRLPVLVGGTAYYIQHLLFPGRLVQERPSETFVSSINPEQASIESIASHFFPNNVDLSNLVKNLSDNLLKLLCYFPDFPAISTYKTLSSDLPMHLLPKELQSGEALAFGIYNLLQHFDPLMASRWHWRDIRKTSRNLTIILTRQERASYLMHKQQISQNNIGDDKMIPQYRTLILIPYADPSVLNPRLDSRVDEMIQGGMLEEVESLMEFARDKPMHQGVLQAIGFKELYHHLSKDYKSESEKNKALRAAIDDIKTSNRKYAKKQILWMKRQLAPLIATEHQRAAMIDRDPLIYLHALDVEDPTQWDKKVREPTCELLSEFLSQGKLSDPEKLSPFSSAFLDVQPALGSKEKLENQTKVVCPICSQSERPVLVEKHLWSIHQSSRSHRRMVRKKEKKPGDN